MDQSSYQRIVFGAGFIAAGTILGMGSSFLTRVIMARHLGSADYGLIVLSLTILNLLTILSLIGFSEGLARELPRTGDRTQLFNSALYVSSITGVILSGIVILFSQEIADLLRVEGLGLILGIFALILPINVLRHIINGGFRGIEDTKGRVLVENVLFQFFVLVGIFIGTIVGFTLFELVLTWIGTIVLAGILGLWIFFRRSGFEVGSTLLSWPEANSVRGLVVFSAPLMFSSAVWELMQNSDNFFVGYFLQSTDVGVYDAAFTLSYFLFVFIGFFDFLFLPVFSNLDHRGMRDEMQEVYQLITKWIIFLSLPFYIMILFFPNAILLYVYGAEYLPGSVAFQIVATGFMVHALSGLNGYALIAIGRTGLILKGFSIAFLTNIALNIILIPHFGIQGAAIASAFAYLVVNVYWTYSLWSITSIIPLNKTALHPVLVTLIGSALAVFSLQTLISHHGVWMVAIGMVLVGCIHTVAILAFGGIEDADMVLLAEIDDRAPISLTIVVNTLRRFTD